VRRAVLLLLALVVTGCGGVREHGTATLWVTRDRGADVLYTGSVPAGLTAMQALDRKLSITTRYGGRFVQSIGGVQGSLSHQQDWFYFVNGVESDRGAAEVKLRPGDVEWWDFRSWTGKALNVPVVAGAFPEPFLHGFEWVKPGATSVVAINAPRSLAVSLARRVHGVVAAKATAGNFIEIGGRLPPQTIRIRKFRSGVLLELGTGAARRLVANPKALRYRYGVAP
jgi:hypothetical protein